MWCILIHPLKVLPFLQRVRISRSEDRCNSQGISVCPSICPSHSSVLYRRMKMRSCSFHRQVGQSFYTLIHKNVTFYFCIIVIVKNKMSLFNGSLYSFWRGKVYSDVRWGSPPVARENFDIIISHNLETVQDWR